MQANSTQWHKVVISYVSIMIVIDVINTYFYIFKNYIFHCLIVG